jgi:hypothetical protein
MNIANLKALNEGVEVKGFPLLIKTARNVYVDTDGNCWQDVVFMDVSGEMLGQILLENSEDKKYAPHNTTGIARKYQSKQNICIMEGYIQNTDRGGKSQNKIVVIECFDTATQLSFDQQQELSAEQWQKAHEEEVKSKIRCWLVAACMEHESHIVNEKFKNWINELVEFVYTGE